MNYYLVKCVITINHYMGDQEFVERDHLVKANDDAEAQWKAEKFYHDKSESYGTSYNCYASVEETIE